NVRLSDSTPALISEFSSQMFFSISFSISLNRSHKIRSRQTQRLANFLFFSNVDGELLIKSVFIAGNAIVPRVTSILARAAFLINDTIAFVLTIDYTLRKVLY